MINQNRNPLGTASGRRPMTGMRGIGTGLNKQTIANPAGESGFVSVGEVGDYSGVSGRPTTQQGLGGFKTSGMGQGRRIYDRS